jgi:methionyl-tRNA formyltransferase
MIKKSKTVVFFGSGPVAAASLEFLADNFNIEAVITKAAPPYHKGIAPVEELANKLQLPTIFANTKQNLDDIISSHTFKSRVGILVDYGVIISQKTIDAFKLGIINSHFSLLPQWRGADPITFSILSGQATTGVSLMLIAPSMDTGEIIAFDSINISSDETTVGLTKKLVNLSNQMLLKYIPLYIDGQIKPQEQHDPETATYSCKLSKSDGIIDIKKPATQLEREVRAFLGWPGSQITFDKKTVIVKKSHVSDEATSRLDILCGDGKYLVIDELIAPSGRKMSSKDFLNGYNRA